MLHSTAAAEQPGQGCPSQYVATQLDLNAVVAALAHSGSVSLDTEFMREQTYFPQLCLLQLSVADAIWCIDPLAELDLDSLLDQLFVEGRLKVGHAVRQDYEILWHLRGAVPHPVFDTQIAAKLCGFPDQIGYAALVRELFGVELDKTHTRTDWARRPLSPEQLSYAAMDVRYLEPARHELERRLRELGRLSWMEEECARMVQTETYQTDDHQLWLRIPGAAGLEHAGRRALCALARWRENLARSHDRPRRWIVSDPDLLQMSARRPTSVAELRSCGAFNKSLLQRHGERIVAVIREAEHDVDFDDSMLDRVALLPRARVKQALDFVRSTSGAVGLDPQVVAARKDVELLLAGCDDSKLLSGWRREFIGLPLQEHLAETT